MLELENSMLGELPGVLEGQQQPTAPLLRWTPAQHAAAPHRSSPCTTPLPAHVCACRVRSRVRARKKRFSQAYSSAALGAADSGPAALLAPAPPTPRTPGQCSAAHPGVEPGGSFGDLAARRPPSSQRRCGNQEPTPPRQGRRRRLSPREAAAEAVLAGEATRGLQRWPRKRTERARSPCARRWRPARSMVSDALPASRAACWHTVATKLLWPWPLCAFMDAGAVGLSCTQHRMNMPVSDPRVSPALPNGLARCRARLRVYHTPGDPSATPQPRPAVPCG